MAVNTHSLSWTTDSKAYAAHPVAWIEDLDIWLCSKCGKRIIPPFDKDHFGNPHQIRKSMGKSTFVFEVNSATRCFDSDDKKAIVNYNVKDLYSIKHDKVFKNSSEVSRITYNKKTKSKQI